jgi:acetolactate synthase I/II/III large subunit
LNKYIKLSDYLCNVLVSKGIKTAFIITGGGAMHLNDAITRNKLIKSHFLHHEQSLTMAAEGFYRTNNKIALVNVTTGPGAINALNGVFGAFVDSIPMLIISGQVKTSTMLQLKNKNLRQLGDQEVNLYELAKPLVKYIATPTKVDDTIIAFKKALYHLFNGRPGPVWLDIPIDLQSCYIKLKKIEENYKLSAEKKINDYIHPNVLTNNNLNKGDIKKDIKCIINLINKSKRPLILAGNGVRIANTQDLFLKIINNFKIPAVTGWNAHDLLPGKNKYNCGKPSTVGDRSGNFAISNCDLLIVLGCRLNIRQISYNWENFAKNAKIVMIDIDINEINKNTLRIFKTLHYSLEKFIPLLEKASRKFEHNQDHSYFLSWCKNIKKKYPIINNNLTINHNTINPYILFDQLYSKLNKNDQVVLGNGTACVVGLQCADVKKGIRVFTNSGSASMGYDLPAAIGSSIANKNKRIICVTGDGSIMMNLQELATINYKKLPIKIFILNNDGYHSIKQTQKNFFPDNLVGTSKNNGIGFPDFIKIGKAFNIKSYKINTLEDLKNIFQTKSFNNNKPVIYVVKINKKQDFQPKLKSKFTNNGKVITPVLHDMWPFLSEKEIKNNLIIK